MATSSVLGTWLDRPSTSVYRPIGVLVCKPHTGLVAQLRNMAPFICDHRTCCSESAAEPHGMQCQRNFVSVTETSSGGVAFILQGLQCELYSTQTHAMQGEIPVKAPKLLMMYISYAERPYWPEIDKKKGESDSLNFNRVHLCGIMMLTLGFKECYNLQALRAFQAHLHKKCE